MQTAFQNDQELYNFLHSYLNTSFGLFSITVEKQMGIDMDALIKESENSGQFLERLTQEAVEAVKTGKITLEELVEEENLELL